MFYLFSFPASNYTQNKLVNDSLQLLSSSRVFGNHPSTFPFQLHRIYITLGKILSKMNYIHFICILLSHSIA